MDRARGAAARELARLARRRCSAEHAGRRSPPAASGCGRCSCFVAAGPAPARRRARAARGGRRSSSSTRRRSSTTTCSTAPRCGAAGRRWSPPPGATMATATGDLLFSRAFAELAAQRRAPTRSACSRTRRPRSPQGELLQRADAWNVGVTRERYLAALRPQDRAAVRGRVRARRARGRRRRPSVLGALRPPDRARVPAARRRARRLRARPSGPASTAAPTCSTARSRCR